MTSQSTFLNGRVPTRLRGLAWLALSEVGNVGTPTSTSDSGGGATETWAYGADVPCRIDPAGSGSSVLAGRIDERATHMITVPAGTSFNTNDRFAIAGRGTFEITGTGDQTSAPTLTFGAVAI